jgi:ribonuclease HII
MVICAVVARHDCLETLAEMGVRDSKALSSHRRESLCPRIHAVIDRALIAELTPREIDRDNINALGLREIARMIAAAEPDEVFIDAPTRGRGITSYCQKIRALLPKPGVALIAENKADERYPVVSAASIIAKVTRDSVIEKLRGKYGDFGSGYPSDPRTRKFVADCYAMTGEFPEIVRHKWLTVRRLTDPEQSMFPLP